MKQIIFMVIFMLFFSVINGAVKWRTNILKDVFKYKNNARTSIKLNKPQIGLSTDHHIMLNISHIEGWLTFFETVRVLSQISVYDSISTF